MKHLKGRAVLSKPLLRYAIAKELCRTQNVKAAAYKFGVGHSVVRKILAADIDVVWRIKPEKDLDLPEVQGYLPFK